MTKKKLIKRSLNSPVVTRPLIPDSKAPKSSSGKSCKLKIEVLKHIEVIPSRYQNQYTKSLLGKATPRKAIETKCRECVNFEEVKEQVKNCESYLCPLHAYRPYQKDQP